MVLAASALDADLVRTADDVARPASGAIRQVYARLVTRAVVTQGEPGPAGGRVATPVHADLTGVARVVARGAMDRVGGEIDAGVAAAGQPRCASAGSLVTHLTDTARSEAPAAVSSIAGKIDARRPALLEADRATHASRRRSVAPRLGAAALVVQSAAASGPTASRPATFRKQLERLVGTARRHDADERDEDEREPPLGHPSYCRSKRARPGISRFRRLLCLLHCWQGDQPAVRGRLVMRLTWLALGSASLLGLTVSVGACTGGLAGEDDESASSAAGTGAGATTGKGSGAGAGSGQGGSIGVGGGTPMFETEIVPIMAKSCGAGDNSCHSAVAYAAIPDMGCRGWLSLEDKPLGSQWWDNEAMTWVPTPAPGCPDVELYRRLLDIPAWEECGGVGKRYIVPCDLEASYVWNKVDGGPYCGPPDASDPMPPDEAMDPIEKETLRLWILAGAPRIDGTVDACANPTTSSSASSSGSGMGAVPQATITHPGSNEVRPADTAVPFIGEATDPEDGSLAGSALVWSSNLDGNIGTGENFSALLSPGVHTITLQATDADGNVGTDTIVNLEMTP